ncbi:megakaryocyte stimulating factor [Trypanosoma rangeli]|uniref:Megakaryocyte stimulating factor n=1 Tax=Trypanosoma rangeli TaxID=5698 RepID=A0A3R7KK88_TRYRA|nr:megakaryocyte stimulating factor [Trypanosoma rangeli]RNF09139.1 megakaryocyte stimulating factor [Trypanosoma rangeli]|eukprot:RNF09139.1 megakaryocyte stimulating factor [Trypanosoma rangeli]
MESRARELFRIDVSRGSAADTPLTAFAVSKSPYIVPSPSPGSSSLAHGLEAQESFEENTSQQGPRSAALLRETGQEQTSQRRQEQQGQPFVRGTLTSPVLSLRGDSPSFVSSRPHSPPRIRPTSELLPARDAKDAPRSAPTLVQAEDDMLHGAHACSAQPTAQPRNRMPSSWLGDPTQEGDSISKVLGSVPSVAAVASEEKAARSTTCRVCPLCGVSVVLVGTFVEHQVQWNEHVASWMHQRNLQLRTATQRTGYNPIESTALALTPPFLSGMPNTTEDISASPVLLQPDDTSPEGISLLRAMAFPTRAKGLEAQASAPSSQETRQDTALLTSSPFHVFKNLFPGANPPSTSENNSSGEDHMGIDHTKDCLAPLWKAGDQQQKTIPRDEARGAPPPPPAGRQSDGASNKGKDPSRAMEAEETDHAASSKVSESVSLREELARRKDHQLERTLTKFLIKKEDQRLLLCFRRWFNLMFVRMVNGSSFLNRSLPIHGPVAAAGAAAAATTTMPVVTDSVKPRGEEGDPLLGCDVTERRRENTFESATPSRTGRKHKKDNRNRSKRATGDGGRGGAFMASRVKGFAHVMNNSSSSSVEVEVSKTDVSWHIQHSARPPHDGGESDSEATSRRCSLESDASIQVLLSSLTPRLQERVRTVLRGEPRRSRAFPKTTNVLSAMRCSLLDQALSLSASPLLINDGNHRRSLSLPTTHITQGGLDDVMHGISDSRRGALSSSLTCASPHQGSGTAREIKPESDVLHNVCAVAGVDMVDTQDIPVTISVTARNVSPPPTDPTAMPCLRQGEPLGGSSGCSTSAGARGSPLQLHSRGSLEGHPKLFSKVEPLSSSPSQRRGLLFEGVEERLDSALRESYANQPPLLHQQCDGQRHSSSLRPQTRRGEVFLGRGGARETFKGIPGECYCYRDGAYHRVLDPTAESCYDARGNQLPIFVVRRPTSAVTSPTRRSPARTRPQSPLGPARLNPYCSVCVKRYCIVLVDEFMRPVAASPSRQGRGTLCNGREVHGFACPSRNARSPTSRGVQNPLLSRPAQLSPRRTFSRGRQDRPASSLLPRRCSPATKTDFAAATVGEHASARPNSVSAAPPGESDSCEVHHQDPTPEEEKWVQRQERHLRRRVKSLLWRELPQCRGSQQWAEYLTSLKEAMQTLEALRSGSGAQ